MAIIIDNIELDETNVEFNYASDFIKHTARLVYLTGKAGTGKTTFLKYLRETTEKNTVVLAYTGVAAINAGGQTINSFFKIPFGPFVPHDKRLRSKADQKDADRSTIYNYFQYTSEKIGVIRGLELLIIDEISMVRCDLLDAVDRLLRVFRRRENEPFGGVQVILIGDTFQLPPIAKKNEWDILKPFYESPFFFSSKVIKNNKPVYIELKKIYRQNEQEFIDLLNRVRINNVTQNELNLLNSRYNPTFSPNGNSNYITLATHIDTVDRTNLAKLSELPTELISFEATVTDTFPDNIMPTDRILQLKEGAQIMFIKNDRTKRYYNGKITKIYKIEDKSIIVEFSDGDKITVEKQVWNNINYTWNEKEKKIEEEIIGTFAQFPIKLAWAITVHKSQGLTFEKVIADLKDAFASGQVYVALSRCVSFSGLVLNTKIDLGAIITDPEVLRFAQNEIPSTLIFQELNSGKADFYYKKVREAIKQLDFKEAYENFTKAIKFRNDIETDVFKNYFIAFASRIASFKNGLSGIESKLDNSYSDDIELDSSFGVTSKKFDAQEVIIGQLNNSVKRLIDKSTELEKNTEKDKTKILELISKLSQAERTIKTKQKAIQGHKKTISVLEENIRQMEAEIIRQNNLKWYQKLIGQK